MTGLAYLRAGLASHLSLKCYYFQSEHAFSTSPIVYASRGSGNWFYEVNRHTVYALHCKKDLLFWQLYFSLELQLFTWFCGMILE